MTYEQATSRCWAEIDLDIIRHNYVTAREECPGVKIIPVIKADAYGLGAIRVAPALREAGASVLAVAEYMEGVEAIEACGGDVLVMGVTPDAFLSDAVERGIIVTIGDLRTALTLDAIARERGVTARAHVKIDTGLHRLGLDHDDIRGLIETFSLKNLRAEGLFTHLALRGRESDDVQMKRYFHAVNALKAAGIDPGMLHALDSIGMLKYPEYRLDAVRVGAWIYGSANRSFPHPERCPLPVRLCARITCLRKLDAGECLGYDDSHPLTKDSLIATVSCGYYDGVPRACSKGFAVVRGRRAPIAGLVMMDQLNIDVTDIPGVEVNDAVTFIGDGISLLEASEWYGWNRNELIARMSRRVQRIYKG